MSVRAALVVGVLLTHPQVGDARAEAERLARAGHHAEALGRFQALAAANLDDVEARLWIGRLHGSTGHPARAVCVFQSILATSPQTVEALVGLGSALIDLGRWRGRARHAGPCLLRPGTCGGP